MRNLGMGLGLMVFIALPASAEDLTRRDLNIGVSYGYQGLALRKFINEDNLIYFGASYGKSMGESRYTFGGITSTSSSDSQNYSISAATRHYLSNEKLSSFIQLELENSHSSGSVNSSSNATSAVLGYGWEYLLDAHLSIEARAGLGYSYAKSDSSLGVSQSSNTSKHFYFPNVGVAITHYW